MRDMRELLDFIAELSFLQAVRPLDGAAVARSARHASQSPRFDHDPCAARTDERRNNQVVLPAEGPRIHYAA